MEVDCPESIGEIVVRDEMVRTGLTATRFVGDDGLDSGFPAELSDTL